MFASRALGRCAAVLVAFLFASPARCLEAGESESLESSFREAQSEILSGATSIAAVLSRSSIRECKHIDMDRHDLKMLRSCPTQYEFSEIGLVHLMNIFTVPSRNSP